MSDENGLDYSWLRAPDWGGDVYSYDTVPDVVKLPNGELLTPYGSKHGWRYEVHVDHGTPLFERSVSALGILDALGSVVGSMVCPGCKVRTSLLHEFADNYCCYSCDYPIYPVGGPATLVCVRCEAPQEECECQSK